MRPQSLAGSRLYTKNVGSSLFQDAFSCCKVTYEDGLRHEIQKKAVKNGCRQLQMSTQINFFVTCDLTVLLVGLYIHNRLKQHMLKKEKILYINNAQRSGIRYVCV